MTMTDKNKNANANANADSNGGATNQAHPIDSTRRKLAHTALHLLAEIPFATLTHAKVAAAAEIDVATARHLFATTIDMIDTALMNLDADAAVRLADDLAEEGEASLRDKILEGLIQKFEAMTPHKAALRNIESASHRNPLLAATLMKRFHNGMRVLLAIAGGEGGDNGDNGDGTQQGRTRNIRDALADTSMAAGLGVICMLAWRVWLRDDSPDLAETSRVLDTRLRQAEEWVMCFVPPSQDEGTSEGTGKHKPEVKPNNEEKDHG